MSATCGARTAYPSGTPEFIPVFSGIHVARALVLYAMFCRSLFVLLVIVFPVLLRFTASGIFKHFLIMSLVATVQYGKKYNFRWNNTENYDFWLNNIQKNNES